MPLLNMNILQAAIPKPKVPYAPKPHNRPEHIPWGDEVDQMVPEMVAAMVQRCQPDKIILFGSRSRGEQRADSDVDLLVVMPFLPADPRARRKAQAQVRQSILEMRVVPMDILVSTQETLDEVLDTKRNWCAHYDAMTEGLTLYDKNG